MDHNDNKFVPAHPEDIPDATDIQQNEAVPEIHKYVDHSNDADSSEEMFSEGAVWHGPAYDASDAEEERMRVRAIIDKNVPGYIESMEEAEKAAESPSEETNDDIYPEENEETHIEKVPFYRSGWFTALLCVILPPIGILIAWTNKSLNKKSKALYTVLGILVLALALIAGVIVRQQREIARLQAEADAKAQSAENKDNQNSGPKFANDPDKTEDEIRTENFARSDAYPTPQEFFTSKTTFEDYEYFYLYAQGIFAGYYDYNGTNIAIIQTQYGNMMLLDSMFTLPELTQGDIFYFYYLYLGYDTSLDALFGVYIDKSVEDEGFDQAGMTSYDEGTYVVGTDIEPGEYFMYPKSSDTPAKVQIFGDDKYIEQIISEEFTGSYFITVSEGQTLVVKNAQFAFSDTVQLSADATLYSSMYRVGIDIQPGTYRLTIDGIAESKYIIYDGTDPLTRQVIDTAAFDKQIVITVENGQILQLIHSYGASYTPDEGEASEEENKEDTEEADGNKTESTT